MKQAVSAKIKYKHSDDEKNFIIRTILPDEKKLEFEFNEANKWTVEVPIQVTYKTLAGKEAVQFENLAQHLMDNNNRAYNGKLELVEVVEKDIVASSAVVDKNSETLKTIKAQSDEIEKLKKQLAEAKAKPSEVESTKEESPKPSEKKGK